MLGRPAQQGSARRPGDREEIRRALVEQATARKAAEERLDLVAARQHSERIDDLLDLLIPRHRPEEGT